MPSLARPVFITTSPGEVEKRGGRPLDSNALDTTYAYLVADAGEDDTDPQLLLDLEEEARLLVARYADQALDACPSCGADEWARDGYAERKHGKVQVFRCRNCGKKRVGHGDTPFKHPLFPPEAMVLTVLLKRHGWTLKRISAALAIVTADGALNSPNRQTVGRWIKKLDPVVTEAQQLHAPSEASAESDAESETVVADVQALPTDERDVAPIVSAPTSTVPEPATPPEFDAPAVIAERFEVQGRLGEVSGQAQGVYVVHDRWGADGDAPRVALKLLPAEGSSSVSREFGLRARLQHPNVAAVHDYGVLPDGRHWFTQELVEGDDLYVAARGRAFEELLEWMVGVVRGCAYLHGRGIVHRDLKPDNILVDRSGVPRIVDFGISVTSEVDEDQGSSGSLAYLPPEALAGAAPTPSFDLYAVGRSFYHVVARELPPEAAPDTALPRLSARRSDVPAWFDDIIGQLTAYQPGDRFPHALSVIDAIVERSGLRFAHETERTLVGRVRSTVLVERQDALAELEAAFAADSTCAGILLQAPAGLGKSRLVEAFRRRRQMAGGEVVDGRLATVLRAVVARLGQDHPLVLHHNDVVQRLTGGDTHRPMLTPRDGIMRDREAVLQLIAAGHRSSTVLVVDDLEHVDEPTVTVLDALLGGGQRDAGTPRVLLAVRSPVSGPHATVVQRWADSGRVRTIELEPLSAAGVQTVVSDALDQSPVAERLAPSIYRASEGNPRFVEEVLRGLLDAGAVDRGSDGVWAVASDDDELPVPGELVEVCRQRFHSLEDHDQRLLELIAVADAALPRDTVERLGETPKALERLLERALVRAVTTEEGAADRVVVAHDAVRSAVCDELSRFELPRLRARVAQQLEEDGCTDAVLLASLWTAVNKPRRALRWVKLAARRARERFDVEEALRWLTALDALCDDAALLEDHLVDAELKAQTLRDLVQMLRFRGRHDEQSVCLDRLSLLAQTEGTLELALEAAALKALFWFDRGRHDLARQMCRSHVERARGLSNKRPLVRFLWVMAMVECRTGGLIEGLKLSDQSLLLLGEDTDPEALELRVQNHINRGNALGQQGQLEGAQAAFEKALSVCHQHDLVSSAIVCTMNIGICLAMQARYGRALGNFDRARTQAKRLGWRELGSSLQVNQAEVERNLGMAAVAAERLAELVAGLTPDRSDPIAISALCTRASCLATLGDLKTARATIEQAVDRVATQPEHPLMARALLTEAEVNLTEGTREARRRATKALKLLVDSAAPPHDKALAAARLARLALEDGELERAQKLLGDGQSAEDGRAPEVREGLVERLYVRARVLLAAGETERAHALVERAADELERQAASLEGEALETFLGLPIHAEVVADARRLLGRTFGGDAGQVNWESELLQEGMFAVRELARAGGLTPVVEIALDTLLRLGGFERGCVLTPQQEGFVQVGARRAGQMPVELGTFGPSDGLLEVLRRTREPVTEHDAAPGALAGAGTREPFCRLALPLVADQRLIGAAYLDTKTPVEPLSRTRRLVIETLADQFALLLLHHLQVDEIERLRRRAEADLTRTQARLAAESARREQAERVVEVQRRTTRLKYRYDKIIHRSETMRGVLGQVDRLVDRKLTVLVNGESGTGKELIARALHYNGPRADGPFVAINCGAIPRDLIESELFGHVRGAFTGAHKDRSGHFELAHTGTLFLDEIGEVSPDVQVRLLRVLETSEVTPVGSSRRVKVDVRIVTATNRDLLVEVREGRFREDLYYRLNTVQVKLPALRDRPEDLPLLVEHFARLVAADRGESPVRFPAGIMRRLAEHRWPGNVRELRNVVEYGALFAEGGVVPEDLVLPF